MAALTTLMTHFCTGEDSWLARSNNTSRNPGTPDNKDAKGKSRRNKHKRDKYGDKTNNTTINAGFRVSKPGQRKGPHKNTNPGPSSLDRILARQCQIHGDLETPATHTNRECWVFKQAGRAGARDKGGCRCQNRRILGRGSRTVRLGGW